MKTLPTTPPLTVLGIDPGSVCLGWGIVQEKSGVVTLVACGAVRPKGKDFSERLGSLFEELHAIIGEHMPAEAAIETVFTDKNILITGGTSGIGLACAKTFLSAGAAVLLAGNSNEEKKQAENIFRRNNNGNS